MGHLLPSYNYDENNQPSREETSYQGTITTVEYIVTVIDPQGNWIERICKPESGDDYIELRTITYYEP